ncbi:exodeoxyribonuclease III [Jonesiaceae bacterium BS-20]|uniref:Exodeoxyribonuclease III n=1 Tax=Jonesiaceae bacterium BS-20 TaxID=3120821 RepID=A0AAU7DWT2_9MICO
MRLATWNINSIRARVDRAIAFLERENIDVLALQETKCKDTQFPFEAFEAAGYEVAHFGLSQWNGVAIISRVGLADVEVAFPNQPQFGEEPVTEARAIAATCGGVRVWSLYIPNGREIDHPHYAYKLEWLAELNRNAQDWMAKDPSAQFALVGDFNVVPFDTDVWDVTKFEGKTHVTPAEREAFFAFEATGLTEVTRKFFPEENKYTYWDYQQLRFPKNEGMRIDFAYTSPTLTERVTDVKIDRDERKGKGASDHVPVILEIA